MTPLRAMSFAPPKQNTPPARVSFESGSPDPVHGRLARAATGVSYDVSSEDVTVSPGGTRRLWLVESERAPRSPGVATVAAVSSAAQPGIARNLGFGAGTRGGACRSEQSDPHKGPAFAHLLRQNELLAKRLTAAHGFLAKAFGGGKETTYMTTALRMKSGAHALKCVAEAVLLGDALLANWDAAWGLQLRHLTRAKERAEGDLERARRQTEAALVEAEAAHQETEAYRAEMDANVDRIERAKTISDELRETKKRAETAEARAADAERNLKAMLMADAEHTLSAKTEAETQITQLTKELEATKASLEEAVENRAREEKSGEVVGKWKNALDSSAQEKIQTEASAAREAQETSVARETESRINSEKLAIDASEPRARAETRLDVAEAKLQQAEEGWKIAEAHTRQATIEAEAERKNARANREETKRCQQDAAATQIELQDKVITLQSELQTVRGQLEECRGALAGAGAAGDVGAQVRLMQETSRKLRRELAAAERVRFAAKIVADDTQTNWIERAVDGDEDALAERTDRQEKHAVTELASRVAAMQREMKNMKQPGSGGSGDAPNTTPGTVTVTGRSLTETSEIETLRTRLAEANAHVSVLAMSRDKALMESARRNVSWGVSTSNFSAETDSPFASTSHAPASHNSVPPSFAQSIHGYVTPAGISGSQPVPASNPNPWPCSKLDSKRAEAERLVAEAESAGREAFGRLKSAHLKFDAKPTGGGSGWARVRA